MTRWSQYHPSRDKLSSRAKDCLRQAQETVWLMQHHDAITSTSYRFVLMDYMKRLQQAFRIMTDVLTELVIDKAIAKEQSFKELDYTPERSEQGMVVGGGPYLHETALVRGSSARTIELERIVDPNMGQPGIDLVVLNSLSREVDTLVSFVCKYQRTGVILFFLVLYAT